METYYNYISVRDQLLSAHKDSKCDFEFGLPKNIKNLHIDDQWTAQCSDHCTPGFCEVHIFIFVPPSSVISQTVNIYYVKKNAVAYVSFPPETLDILRKKKILDFSKLVIEKDAAKVLPPALPLRR